MQMFDVLLIILGEKTVDDFQEKLDLSDDGRQTLLIVLTDIEQYRLGDLRAKGFKESDIGRIIIFWESFIKTGFLDID